MDSVTAVTLVFVEVEDAASLWQRLGGRVEPALLALDAAAEECARLGGGRIVKSTSGSAMLAFEAAAGAVRGAVALTERAAAFPDPLELRIGIHAGTPLREEDPATGREDFFGPDVNRAARLMTAGHGGQILLSRAAAMQAAEAIAPLPHIDLGEHRLRGLERPERILQLLPPSMAARRFPALRTLTALPTNLPGQTSSFVGRGTELARVAGLLDGQAGRVVVVTGAAGVGKSRFAVRAAADALERFPGGCWFADLSDAETPEAVATSVIAAFGGQVRGGDGIAEAGDQLASRPASLILLDTADHLLGLIEPLLGRWRARAPGTSFLVTSRVSLPGAGIDEIRLEPFPSPPGDGSLSGIAAGDAVRLFVDRARDARPDFALTEANAADVATICSELDGIPLAIELAAARSRILQPAELVRKLGQKFQLLRSTRKDITRRQQTLQGAIEWGEEQLDAADREALRQLAVFHGGFSPEAADFVVQPGPEGGGMRGSEAAVHLARRSLLSVREGLDGLRFQLYRPVREHAWKRLADGADRGAVELRHEGWFFRVFELPAERDRHDRAGWRIFADDAENLAEVHRRAVARGPGHEIAVLKAAMLIAKASVKRGNLSSALARLAPALEAARRSPAWPEQDCWFRARALFSHATSLRLVGRYAESLPCLEDALEEARAAASPILLAEVLWDLAHACGMLGLWPRGDAALEESEKHARAHGLKVRLASILILRSGRHQAQGEFERGLAFARESLELSRQTNRRDAIAETSNVLAIALAVVDRYLEAVPLLRESVEVDTTTENRSALALHMSNLAEILAMCGEWGESFRSFERAQALFLELGRPVNAAYTRMRRAECEALAGKTAEARKGLDEVVPTLGSLGVAMGARLTLLRARVLLGEGAPAEALSCLESGLPALVQGEDIRDWCEAHCLRARALLAVGDPAGALTVLGGVLELESRGRLLPSFGVAAWLLRARALEGQGKRDEAREAA
ncbi:MAG: hypothetical protein HUU15_16630, partial [Candidatus Brocadiae bacterium]|nr:hypothetical protein [Candidatus Brocadiia bacterium]